jgi:hypothetical protein
LPPTAAATSAGTSAATPVNPSSASIATIDQGKPLINKAGYMIRAALFRMAAGFPYYVQMFSEPDERCTTTA